MKQHDLWRTFIRPVLFLVSFLPVFILPCLHLPNLSKIFLQQRQRQREEWRIINDSCHKIKTFSMSLLKSCRIHITDYCCVDTINEKIGLQIVHYQVWSAVLRIPLITMLSEVNFWRTSTFPSLFPISCMIKLAIFCSVVCFPK